MFGNKKMITVLKKRSLHFLALFWIFLCFLCLAVTGHLLWDKRTCKYLLARMPYRTCIRLLPITEVLENLSQSFIMTCSIHFQSEQCKTAVNIQCYRFDRWHEPIHVIFCSRLSSRQMPKLERKKQVKHMRTQKPVRADKVTTLVYIAGMMVVWESWILKSKVELKSKTCVFCVAWD